jgi:FMN phosphatase YigB (HAD superfamily)
MGAVIFDAGKVLLDFDYEPVRRALDLKSTEDIPELFSAELVGIVESLHLGKVSCTQFWCHFRERYGYQGTFAEFEEDVCTSFEPIPRGLEVFEEMLDRPDLKVAILSDNHHICTRWMARVIPQVFRADVVTLSQEVGMLKPDPRIYHCTVARLDLPFEECLFIDDRQNNIEAARDCKIRTVLHTDWNRSYSELTDFLQGMG